MFSAKSKGLIRTHFTRNSFQLDKIECQWLYRRMTGPDNNTLYSLGQFPDGTTVNIIEFEDAVVIGFPPKEYTNPEALRYLHQHRKLLPPAPE